MGFFEKFGRSAMELKTLRCITVTGVLIALDIVLKMTVSVSIPLETGGNVKVSFAYLALASIGMLFGPTVSFLSGIITDVIGFLMKPDGGFSPLYTFVEGMGGLIYGMFLYGLKPLEIRSGTEKKSRNWIQILRIVLSKVTVVIVCNLLLTPMANVISGYKSAEAELASYPLKLIKNAINCPIDCVVMILLLFPILAAYKKIFRDGVSVQSVKDGKDSRKIKSGNDPDDTDDSKTFKESDE